MGFRHRILGVACALLLSACASTSKTAAVAPPAPIAGMLGAADEAVRLGQVDQATVLLAAAAQAYPADKEPWLRLARRSMEQKRYRDALNHAQEVLARDGEERDAHAIAVLSATRLAGASAASLARGGAWSALPGAPQRADAIDAARQLQASLGEQAGKNVPASRAATMQVAAGPAPVRKATPTPNRAPAAAPPATTGGPAAGSASGPLDLLDALKRSAAKAEAPGR